MVYENPDNDDPLDGMPGFAFTFNNYDKSKKLTSRNPYIRKSNGLHCIIDDPFDKWSTYKCLDWYLDVYLAPGWEGELFLRSAKKPTLDKRRKEGNFYYADDKQVQRNYTDKNGMQFSVVGSHGKIGKNHIVDIFKGLAERCGFVNPERFTGRAARRCGISNAAGKWCYCFILFI